MNELTIVTAFFDIGRKDFEIISRNNETYIQYFECWARIQNKVVIYTQHPFKDIIMDIRKKYHQEKNTDIIVIDDIDSIDSEIYEKYKAIAENGNLEKFKLLRNTIAANKPRYIYLMLLKYWFLMDAERKGLINDFAVWLDFGYGHGDFFADPKQFDFKWQYDFDRKITLFTCHDLDEVPMYEVVRCSLNYIMGFMVLAPKELCGKFWTYVREAAYMMAQMGFIDDDQTVLLAAYRNHPDDFHIIPSDWFMPLVTHGGVHLTLTRDIKEKNVDSGTGWKGKINLLFKKSKERRTGFYRIIDIYRKCKMEVAGNPFERQCKKLCKDCADRTYEQVYELYKNDRRH